MGSYEALCYQTFTYLMTLFTMVRWSLVPPWWLEMVRVTRTRVHGEVLVSMGHGRGCGGLSGEAARTSDVILTSTVSTPPHSHQPDIQLPAVVLTAAIHTARYFVFPTPMISDRSIFYAISDLISIVEFLFIEYLRHWVVFHLIFKSIQQKSWKYWCWYLTKIILLYIHPIKFSVLCPIL